MPFFTLKLILIPGTHTDESIWTDTWSPSPRPLAIALQYFTFVASSLLCLVKSKKLSHAGQFS